MDLYEFISSDFIKPSKREESPIAKEPITEPKEIPATPPVPSENEMFLKRIKELESLVEILQSERKEISSRLKSTEYDKASLEGLIQELRDKQSYLIEQIKSVKDDKDASLITNIENLQRQVEVLSHEKTDLLNSNKQLESTIELLNKERQAIEGSLQSIKKEKDDLLRNSETLQSNQDSKIADLEKSISLLQVELKEKQLIIERLTENIIEYKTHIDDLKKDHTKYKQNTIVAIIAICIVAIITIIILLNNKIKDKTSLSMKPTIEQSKETKEIKQESMSTQPNTQAANTNTLSTTQNKTSQDKATISPDKPLKNNIATSNDKKVNKNENRANVKPSFSVNAKGFKVSLKPLTKERLSKLNIPSEVISKIDYECAYLINIKTKIYLLDEDFKKSPNISFLYKDGDRQKPVEIITSSYKRSKKTSTVEIQSIVTTEKGVKPLGVVIGPMKKNNLKVTII